jgi:hypothetical protein
MKKSTINFIINAVLFLCMAAITGIGFLIKYVLIPGSERWVKYGENVELSFWGMDRHDWSYIHLVIGFIILALLVLHIVLHWNIVIAVYRKIFNSRPIYNVLSVVFIMIGFVMILAPFFVKATVSEHEYGVGRHETQELNRSLERQQKQELNRQKSSETLKVNEPKEHQGKTGQNKEVKHQEKEKHENSNSLNIRGFMTMNEVSNTYDIPCDVLKTKLGIPTSASDREKLGKLKRKYDFKMSDVEEVITKYKK